VESQHKRIAFAKVREFTTTPRRIHSKPWRKHCEPTRNPLAVESPSNSQKCECRLKGRCSVFHTGYNEQVFSPRPWKNLEKVESGKDRGKILARIRISIFEKNAKTALLRRTSIPKN